MAKGFRLKFIQDDTVEQTEVIIRARSQDKEVEEILKALEMDTNRTVFCETLSSSQLIDKNDIVIISKSGRYLAVKTINGEFVVNEPLYTFETKLDPVWFIKISQSEIVNLKYVKGWSLSKSGIITIEMVNGIKSFTSRRYARQIREVLGKGVRG
ncbi:MAG: LytTR family transcriptional regulator [Spirochaetales bacterium]|nr:LytTR family transcriptional regulator [Spirochaetales bacterium]